MKYNLLYIDTYSSGTMHEQFNAAMYLICLYTFDEVYYYGGKSSLNSTLQLISPNLQQNYNIKKILVVNGKGRLALLIRTIVSGIQNIRILLQSKENEILVYNSNNFMSLRILNAINKILRRKIIICCHSELSFINNNSKNNNYIYRMRTRNIRDIFLNSKTSIAENLYFLVLGDSILNNLSTIVSEEKLRKILSLDHAYIFNSIKRIHQNSSSLRIGVVGTMAEEKGAQILIEIAHRLNLKKRDDISIAIVGKILCDTDQFVNAGINLPENLGRDSIPREEYDNCINNLDYILYLYPKDTYKFSASGSLFDALKIECPAISFKNDYFNYIFKKFGNFGFLVENLNEMVNLIEQLSLTKIKNENIDYNAIKISLSPEVIKNDFINHLKRIGFLGIRCSV